MNGSREMFFRITALWAVTESILGGILHGLKVPVTGLLVGGLAVIYISLIARYGRPADILKATVLVMLIKALLAPHSPFGAYFAVGFQGLAGYIMFSIIPVFRGATLVLGAVNLLESALQKLIVTTLIFGMDVWVAVEEFIAFVMLQVGYQGSDYLKTILAIYLGVYFFAGLFFGYLAGAIPSRLSSYPLQYPHLRLHPPAVFEQSPAPGQKRKRKAGKVLIKGLWIFVLILLTAQFIFPEFNILPQNRLITLLIRSFVVIIGWLFIIGPWLSGQLQAWLKKQRAEKAGDFEQLLGLLPETRWLLTEAWKKSGEIEEKYRLNTFLRILLVNLAPR
jgi:hypothetical protein